MTNNFNNIPFYVDQEVFLITVSYDALKKISGKIQKALFENGKYSVESNISGDVFQIFVDYWINNKKISFNSDNLYELYLLSKEFELDLGIEGKKEYKNTLSFSILKKATQNNKNKEMNEDFIAENIAFYLQNCPNTLAEVPITSLYNIFNNENFNLNGHHDLAYKFITGFHNGTRNSNLFVLIKFLDINYLSFEAKKDYLLNHEIYYDFQPKNLINYYFQIQKENDTIKLQNELLQQDQVMKGELQKQNEQLQKQIEQLQQEIKKLNYQLKIKNDQLKNKESHYQNQQNDNFNSKRIIIDLKNENKSLKNQQHEIEKLKKQNQDQQQEIKKLIKQNQDQHNQTLKENAGRQFIINNKNDDDDNYEKGSIFISMVIIILYFLIYILFRKLLHSIIDWILNILYLIIVRFKIKINCITILSEIFIVCREIYTSDALWRDRLRSGKKVTSCESQNLRQNGCPN